MFYDLIRGLIRVLVYFVNYDIVGRMIAIFWTEYYAANGRRLKGKLRRCGNNFRVGGRVVITDPSKVVVGNNVGITGNCYFSTEGGLIIGDNVHISRNVTIYTQSHNYEGVCLPYDDTLILKPVIIGKNVWIGMNVSIIPGVRIGDGAIIGLGTVVSRDVPALAIVVGQPHRIVKFRDRTHYYDLERRGMYGGRNGIPLPEGGIVD